VILYRSGNNDKTKSVDVQCTHNHHGPSYMNKTQGGQWPDKECRGEVKDVWMVGGCITVCYLSLHLCGFPVVLGIRKIQVLLFWNVLEVFSEQS
jgi:hypothetical protein